MWYDDRNYWTVHFDTGLSSLRLRSYQHGQTETHVFPSVRGHGCVHTNTEGPGWTEKNGAYKETEADVVVVVEMKGEQDFLCTLLTDRAMCMVNTIIWYQYSLMIRLNLPSTWGWTLTHFTIYWMSALQSWGKNIPTTASLVKDTRPHLNCGDQFLVVHAARLCLSRKSNALSKYRNAWKVQSLERTDGKRSCMHVLKKIRPCPSVSVWMLFTSPVGIKSDFLCTFFTYDSRPCPSMLVWTYP